MNLENELRTRVRSKFWFQNYNLTLNVGVVQSWRKILNLRSKQTITNYSGCDNIILRVNMEFQFGLTIFKYSSQI